ncbi:MAG: hypothetical protein ACM3ZQ_02485 [Bacillota bacterium]
MSTTSDDSREAVHCGSSRQTSSATQPPFSNLALTVNQVSRTLDIGNPVSCWCRQAALVLMQAPALAEPHLVPEAVLRGSVEALDQGNTPQTMVGTVLHLSLLLEQLVDALDSGRDSHQTLRLASRYRQVADANLVSIPWRVVLEGRVLSHEAEEHLDALLGGL